MLTKCRAEQQMKIKTCLFYQYPRSYFSEWCHVPINIRQQDHAEKGSMCCVVKCIWRRNQARVKNADLHHPFCTVVMQRRKSASPILSVLINKQCGGSLLIFNFFLKFVHLFFHVSERTCSLQSYIYSLFLGTISNRVYSVQ